jgi:hypothetical protein
MVLNSQPEGLFFEPLEGGGQSKKFRPESCNLGNDS